MRQEVYFKIPHIVVSHYHETSAFAVERVIQVIAVATWALGWVRLNWGVVTDRDGIMELAFSEVETDVLQRHGAQPAGGAFLLGLFQCS